MLEMMLAAKRAVIHQNGCLRLICCHLLVLKMMMMLMVMILTHVQRNHNHVTLLVPALQRVW